MHRSHHRQRLRRPHPCRPSFCWAAESTGRHFANKKFRPSFEQPKNHFERYVLLLTRIHSCRQLSSSTTVTWQTWWRRPAGSKWWRRTPTSLQKPSRPSPPSRSPPWDPRGRSWSRVGGVVGCWAPRLCWPRPPTSRHRFSAELWTHKTELSALLFSKMSELPVNPQRHDQSPPTLEERKTYFLFSRCATAASTSWLKTSRSFGGSPKSAAVLVLSPWMPPICSILRLRDDEAKETGFWGSGTCDRDTKRAKSRKDGFRSQVALTKFRFKQGCIFFGQKYWPLDL